MSWMIHAVVRSGGDAPLDCPRHGRINAAGGFAALVTPAKALDGPLAATPVNPAELEEDMAALVRLHDDLIAAYAVDQDVLPLRFGHRIEAAEDAGAVLSQNISAFERAFRALAGRREIVVRISRSTSGATGPIPGPQPGAEPKGYLAQRLAKRKAEAAARRRIDQFVTRVRLVLEAHGLPMSLPDLRADGTRVAGWSCLLRMETIDRTREALHEFSAEAGALGLAVSVSGPYAPFSFASQALEDLEPTA